MLIDLGFCLWHSMDLEIKYRTVSQDISPDSYRDEGFDPLSIN